MSVLTVPLVAEIARSLGRTPVEVLAAVNEAGELDMSMLSPKSCPAWCDGGAESHVWDRAGRLSHTVDTAASLDPALGASVVVTQANGEPSMTYVGLHVAGGRMWAPAEVVELVEALVRAVWLVDPDFDVPAGHDTGGWWKAAGRVVRERLKGAGVSQTEAAPMMGLTQPELSIMSRGLGVRTFTLTELATIAEIVGCTVSEMVADIEVAR